MIGLIKGTLYSKTSNQIIVLVNGVGYILYITPDLHSKSKTNTEITLFVHTHVKDDAIELFGFSDQNQLNLFNMLITVSGIGPKTALLIIDRGVDNIEKAIKESNVGVFSAIPRLGRKNSQKIILELKNKIGSIKELDLSDNDSEETKDLIEALMGMGFGKQEILQALKKIDPDINNISQKIRQILKILKK